MPLQLPLAPEVILFKNALLVAVQAQPAEVVTLTLPVPPLAPSEALVGGRAKEHVVPPVQIPLLLQVSPTVLGLLSSQVVPFGLKPFAGQAALDPVQLSATSHCPAEARPSVTAGLKLSVGQLPLVPVQCSATSHAPAAGRHWVPAATN